MLVAGEPWALVSRPAVLRRTDGHEAQLSGGRHRPLDLELVRGSGLPDRA